MGTSLKFAGAVSQANSFWLAYFKTVTKSFGGYLQLKVRFLIFLPGYFPIWYTELVFDIYNNKPKRLLFTHKTYCICIVARSFFASY